VRPIMVQPITVSMANTFTRGKKSGINYDAKLQIILTEVTNHSNSRSLAFKSIPSYNPSLSLSVLRHRMYPVLVSNTSKLALNMGKQRRAIKRTVVNCMRCSSISRAIVIAII
jgi:hypothetical protein